MSPRRLAAFALFGAAALAAALVAFGIGGSDVTALVVHYGVAGEEDGPPLRRTERIEERAAIQDLWAAIDVRARSRAACSCKLSNWIEVERASGARETWHFCHRPDRLGVPGGSREVTRAFYEKLRARLEEKEGRPVALLCHDEDLPR